MSTGAHLRTSKRVKNQNKKREKERNEEEEEEDEEEEEWRTKTKLSKITIDDNIRAISTYAHIYLHTIHNRQYCCETKTIKNMTVSFFNLKF